MGFLYCSWSSVFFFWRLKSVARLRKSCLKSLQQQVLQQQEQHHQQRQFRRCKRGTAIQPPQTWHGPSKLMLQTFARSMFFVRKVNSIGNMKQTKLGCYSLEISSKSPCTLR